MSAASNVQQNVEMMYSRVKPILTVRDIHTWDLSATNLVLQGVSKPSRRRELIHHVNNIRTSPNATTLPAILFVLLQQQEGHVLLLVNNTEEMKPVAQDVLRNASVHIITEYHWQSAKFIKTSILGVISSQ